MKLKFGDKVRVVSEDFYHGAEGIVIYFNKFNDGYEVRLNHGVTREFNTEALVKKGRQNVKKR